MGRSNFMMNYYKNYKEELEEIEERVNHLNQSHGGLMGYSIVI